MADANNVEAPKATKVDAPVAQSSKAVNLYFFPDDEISVKASSLEDALAQLKNKKSEDK